MYNSYYVFVFVFVFEFNCLYSSKHRLDFFFDVLNMESGYGFSLEITVLNKVWSG